MMTTDQIPSHDSSPSEFVALVVDSDPASRLILRGLLESQGGHVIEAENSSAAKAVFGVCAPDIAVLSVTPETGGFEACAQIRALPNNVATPVLTILDLDDEITVDRALAAGAADYVTKPIRPVILRQRIRRLLRVHNIDTAMLRAKREWETAFDAVPDLIILTDLNGKIIRCNLAAIQHLETICTELIGRDLRAVLLQSTGQELNLPFREPREMQFPSLPGWFEVRTFPGHLEGRWHTIVYVLKDVTERKQLQESVQNSERRFKALVENISEGIQLLGFNGKTIYASPTALRITGYSDEYIGSSPFDYLHPDDVPHCLELFNQLSQQPDTVMTAEIRTRHKNGKWIWLEVTGHNLLTEPGIESILVHFKDITDRKQDELKFRQLSQAVEQSPISIVITDPSGNIEYVNPRFTQLTGYSFREVVGQNPRLLKSDQTPPETFVQLWAAISSGREWHGEFINRKKSGELFAERASVSPVTDEKGRVTHFLALKEDVTERKQLGEALQQNEKRFRAMIENSADAIALVDAKGRITYATPAITGIGGYQPEDYVGHKAVEFIHPEDQPGLLDDFTELVQATGGVSTRLFRARHIDGSWRWVDVTTSNQLADPAVKAIIANFRDVTEGKRAEELLKQTEEHLRLIVETVPIPILIGTAAEGTVLFANTALGEMIGLPVEELLGRRASDFYLDPSQRQALLDIMKREGKLRNYELAIKKADQTPLWVLVSLQPLIFADQPATVAVLYDITERKHAEAALAESEQRFRQFFAASPDAVLVVDPSHPVDWKIVDCNEAACQMNGYTRDEMIGQSVDLLNTTVGTASERTDYLERLRSAGVMHLEVVHRRKDGIVFPVEISTTIFTVNGHELILGIDRDITGRKQAEKDLRLSEERFQLVTYATNDAVWDLDLFAGKRWWNRGVRLLFGYTVDQISPDQAWWEARIHPDDRPKVLASFQAALESDGQFWSKEYRFLRSDGSYAYVFDRGYIMQDDQGTPVRVIGAMMDLTERKQSEEALRASQAELSEALKIARLAYWEYDRPNDEFIFNDHFYSIFHTTVGREGGYRMSSTHYAQKFCHPDDKTVVGVEIGKMLNSTDRHYRAQLDHRIVYLEGSTGYISVRINLERDEQGQPLRCYGTVQDITERERMQEALLASQKLADLGTLAAGVAHEMNSPLQVITGLSQSLLRKVSNGGVEPGQLERNLDVIQRNGWRCAEIVRSLHTYARNSGGAMEPTHLNELVCDGLLLIEHQLKSWANISVRTILSEDLPPLTCDRNQITQILINLLTNARDAMPNGGEITITTGHDPKSDQVMLQISDTGIGIPNSIRSKIFDPFFTTKPLDKGTGLGLSIVDGIVRAHGGTIEVDAALPQGTIFTARFPAKPLKLPASDTESIPGRFNDVGRTTAEKPI